MKILHSVSFTKCLEVPSEALLWNRLFPRLNSTSSATLLTAFGGRVDDLAAFLVEERLPQGWEPRIRYPHGLTILEFNQTIFPLERGIRESDWENGADNFKANSVSH